MKRHWLVLLACQALCLLSAGGYGVRAAAVAALPNPILFVTQVPVPEDFTTIGSVFGNHGAAMDQVARGGDLWIRYPDGSLKNLTAAAGFGEVSFQGATSIAVRDPAVSWDGKRALFSMVVGAPTQRWQIMTFIWQIYEISGLAANDTPVIKRIANQPATYNNISPIYGSDDQIIFTSDRPRNGQAHLYPQLDEYEEAPTNTGLWSLDPANGDLALLDHSPSGDFTPIIDSFGRIIFTRWDHLQRDQQADSDEINNAGNGTFNYASEAANAARLNIRTEVFPEPREQRVDLLKGTNLAGHTINHFFPWMVNQDGTEAETLNHIGRHELHGYFNLSLTDDAALTEFNGATATSANQNRILNLLQIKEDPQQPGRYIGISAPEFETHASGQIVSLLAPPTLTADKIAVTNITHRDTGTVTDTPKPTHSGHYRDPLPLDDGTLLAVHTAATGADDNIGSLTAPRALYDFRIKQIQAQAGTFVAGAPLTSGISKSISWYSPDELTTYNGVLWELQPVEVYARPRPTYVPLDLPEPERRVLARAEVSLEQLQSYLRRNNLALIITRNVTSRDTADRQQPFNLRVAGSTTKTIDGPGKLYDVARMQMYQADQIRGMDYDSDDPRPGRRVLAQPMHDPAVRNPPLPAGAAPGSITIAADGSMAAFVPARRAMTWALTDPNGTQVVRERYWLTFQPGEVRVCASCHGLNTNDQAGDPAPDNEPQALADLVTYWKENLAGQQRYVFIPFVGR